MANLTGGSANIDNETLDINSNGEIFVQSTPNDEAVISHEIEIIELQANATITPFDHDTLISDTFSDSEGYRDTVNTTNTTAPYDSSNKKYIRNIAGTNDTSLTVDSVATDKTELRGVKISTNLSGKVVTVTKGSSVTATKCYVTDESKSVLQTADFSGNVATFSSPVTLNASTVYYILLDNDGSSYTPYFNSSPGFPIAGTFANFTASWANGADTTATLQCIESFTYSNGGTTSFIECDLPSISGTVIKTELIVNDVDRETGDSITYELEDASSNTDSNKELETVNDIVNLVSNPSICRINLIGKETSPTNGYPSVKTYALKLWKAT